MPCNRPAMAPTSPEEPTCASSHPPMNTHTSQEVLRKRGPGKGLRASNTVRLWTRQ